MIVNYGRGGKYTKPSWLLEVEKQLSSCNREDKTCPLSPPCGVCVTASQPITDGNWDEIKQQVLAAPGMSRFDAISEEIEKQAALDLEEALRKDAEKLEGLTGNVHRFDDVFDALGLPEPAIPVDSAERKNTPIFSGVLAYFPRAIAYVAKVSKAGNDKHNPGEPLHWSKGKSQDHEDCCARHLCDVGSLDPEDNLLHSGKLAWRALALLETELEADARGISVHELKRMYREGEL